MSAKRWMRRREGFKDRHRGATPALVSTHNQVTRRGTKYSITSGIRDRISIALSTPSRMEVSALITPSKTEVSVLSILSSRMVVNVLHSRMVTRHPANIQPTMLL
jgi:hypothetical protein